MATTWNLKLYQNLSSCDMFANGHTSLYIERYALQPNVSFNENLNFIIKYMKKIVENNLDLRKRQYVLERHSLISVKKVIFV
jgi:hypothetical protein